MRCSKIGRLGFGEGLGDMDKGWDTQSRRADKFDVEDSWFAGHSSVAGRKGIGSSWAGRHFVGRVL